MYDIPDCLVGRVDAAEHSGMILQNKVWPLLRRAQIQGYNPWQIFPDRSSAQLQGEGYDATVSGRSKGFHHSD